MPRSRLGHVPRRPRLMKVDTCRTLGILVINTPSLESREANPESTRAGSARCSRTSAQTMTSYERRCERLQHAIRVDTLRYHLVEMLLGECRQRSIRLDAVKRSARVPFAHQKSGHTRPATDVEQRTYVLRQQRNDIRPSARVSLVPPAELVDDRHDYSLPA